MINYRNIFNSSYNYIGLILIFILSLLIIIIEKDTVSSIYRISKYAFISGVIILSLTLISGMLIKNKFVVLNLLLDIISLGGIKIVYLIHEYIENEYMSVWMLLLLVFVMIFLFLYLSYTLLKNLKSVIIANKYIRKGGNNENKKCS